jgi:hypothetical protein
MFAYISYLYDTGKGPNPAHSVKTSLCYLGPNPAHSVKTSLCYF